MKKKAILFVMIGLFIGLNLFFQACEEEVQNNAPTASFVVAPSTGDTQTLFVFDASNSSDAEDTHDQLLVRWDFDGDGSWDSDWSNTKIFSKNYSNEGTYSAELEVKDTKGLTGQTTKTITVSVGSGNVIGTFIDTRDDQVYTTVEIGAQTWFSQNLNFETANSWWHNNDPALGELYGRLYLWESALTACPAGWHLPTDDDWKQLELELGMSQSEVDKEDGWRGTDEGSKMKSVTGWNDANPSTNSSGFTALPGGFRLVDGSYSLTGWVAWWWSANEYDSNGAINRLVSSSYDQVERDEDNKLGGMSVRCVKD